MKKSERINQELFYLNDKTEFNLKDLMHTFNISKSTALRDIAELESLGVPLYATSGRYGSYHIIQESLLPPVYFSEKEIFAIFFSLQLLRSTSNSPFGHTYQQINNKLLNTFSKEKQKLINQTMNVVQYNSLLHTEYIDYLDTLFENILKQQVITFNYSRGETRERTILPVKLVTRNGYWYCLGFDIHKQAYRTFRCDFISQIKVDDNHQLDLSQEEINEGLVQQQNDYRFLDFKVDVTKNARTFYQQNNYPNISFEQNDESCFLTGFINPNEISFLANYLLGFGTDIITISPYELHDAYKILIEKLQHNLTKMNEKRV